ncbi:MAG TPA: O-antigen ligase family protein [Acidimicrobiales bacterium]|nr:O-antigen ligase family protein [Acidimicrobiales bacterium]
MAGCLVILDGRAAVAALVCLAGVGGVLVVGPERLGTVTWAATAFAAPLSGVRVWGVALSDVFLVAAVGLTLPSFAAGYRRLPLPVRPDVFVGLATVACGGVIGTFFAAHPGASLAAMARFVLASAGSVAAVALWAPPPARLRWFCWLWLAGAVFNACWAIALGPVDGLRPAGLSTHPNHLGLVCMLGAALALGLALGGRRAARRVAAAALAPLVLALLASGSRAALVGLAVSVPVFAVLTRRLQVAVRALALTAVLGVAVLAGLAHVPEQSGLGRLVGDRTAAESDIERVEHLSRSLDRLERHPLTGEGFESSREAHNIYLQVAVAAGPLGVVGFAVVVRSVLRARAVVRRRAPVAGDRALLAGLVAGYAGYLVAGAFQNLLWDRYLWLYVSATLVLAATLADGEDRPAGPGDRAVAPVWTG